MNRALKSERVGVWTSPFDFRYSPKMLICPSHSPPSKKDLCESDVVISRHMNIFNVIKHRQEAITAETSLMTEHVFQWRNMEFYWSILVDDDGKIEDRSK